MSSSSLETADLRCFIQRWQDGDTTAANTLFRAIERRLEHLARQMLRGFPNVRDLADTGDIYQGAAYRLLNALRTQSPPSTRDFFNMAAAYIRRELLDLARRFGKHERRILLQANFEHSEFGPFAPDSLPPDELELWTRFHEAVGHLPPEEREVFSLAFYHGWTQSEMADLFGVVERTVRRRWQAACIKVSLTLGGRLPEL